MSFGDAISEFLVDAPAATGAGPVVHRCGGRGCMGGCDAVVPQRGDFCQACAEHNSRELRTNLLKNARRSLPDWPEARFDHANFPKRVVLEVARPAVAWRPTTPDGSTNNLTLLGSTGVGKTTAAVAICHRILETAETKAIPAEKFRLARGLRWTAAWDLGAAGRQWKLGDGLPPQIAEAVRAPLLIIDDLGKESRPRDTEDDAIWTVLDQRYRQRGFVTIVTSKLRMSELGERYGLDARRRFTERGVVVEHFR